MIIKPFGGGNLAPIIGKQTVTPSVAVVTVTIVPEPSGRDLELIGDVVEVIESQPPNNAPTAPQPASPTPIITDIVSAMAVIGPNGQQQEVFTTLRTTIQPNQNPNQNVQIITVTSTVTGMSIAVENGIEREIFTTFTTTFTQQA
ncbi:hypothetical protein H4219_004090 [Mycoemilia scoparia]|uniref:Uncharacterized protein n=1 Tax=Mycoemilia scoparia TaxID=417184 RepID=A0A9W8DRQ2_9FUNG|nr:hypothetical protein H4219_004090 [Mycoemilia scoparia]